MSRSQKVNEPETMSTASAYLYKEQAECVQQVHQYLCLLYTSDAADE